MLKLGRCLALVIAVLAVAISPARSGTAEIYWPDSLKADREGYPAKEDLCRRVGDTSATAPFMDRSTLLIGCPGARGSYIVAKFLGAHGGRAVGVVDGFTLIAVPMGQPAKAATPAGHRQLRCARPPAASVSCSYSAIQKEGGVVIVQIAWPDGKSRAVYFANGRVTGADTSKADGKIRIATVQEVDRYIVTIGVERYDIPASVVGR